jgi:diguanylate cyclase (GGDEF)-like protein
MVPPQPGGGLAEILFVDDRRVNAGVLSAILRETGHALKMAPDGPSALESIRRSPPELVLLDLRLPGLDGFDVCRRLRADEATRGLPVIFVGALADGADRQKAFEAGASDYLLEPFPAAEVLARVESQLSLVRLQREIARKTEDLERANRMLQSLAYLDPLTGLPSRRHFEDSLEQEWRRARRQQTTLTLVLVDIDQFRAFVEAYGTESGDDCLKRVAVELSGTLRRGGDLVARCGGDEFAAILPGTDSAGACVVAQEVAQRVLALRIPHRGSPLQVVSLSLGLALANPARSESASPAPLLSAAAQALLRARAEGGNRIVAAG